MTAQPRVRCSDFVDSVTEWMEGTLVEDDRLALEEHLVVCPDCTEYTEQLRLSVATLRSLGATSRPRTAPPPEAGAALLAALRQRRRDNLA